MKETKTLLAEIDSLKTQLDALRPLPELSLKSLYQDLSLRLTYHSNAIEGNTLSLMETRLVLEGLTIGGKKMSEHFEAINHNEAFFYVESLISKGTELTDWEIRNIHRLVLKNIDDQNAGRYRVVNVRIAGARHEPPDFMMLPQLMEEFITWYSHDARSLHPVVRAAMLHLKLVGIHPFVDGNGRTSRLIMNFELIKYGFPVAIIPVENRLIYYEALDSAHVDQQYDPFIALIARCVLEGFQPYFRLMGIQKLNS
ncbi:Fic family protein [candidate division KSB1 bacterium]|nr:Fic family protein [candidate division KSB1 bacterium]